MNNNYNNLEKHEQEELLTQLANFISSSSGQYLVHMIESTKSNRVEDLIYAKKEDVFKFQGELQAYHDLLNLLKPETIRALREQLNEEE